MKTLLLILVLSITASAQSIKEGKAITDWIPVGVSPDITKRAPGAEALDPKIRIEGAGAAEMSFANVKRSGHAFKGWVRFEFPATAIVLEGRWKEIRFYVVCDCQKNSFKALTGIAYGVDGTIKEDKINQNLDTLPGSVGRQMFEFFCERGGPSPSQAPTLKP